MAPRTAGTASRSGISWVTSWRLPPVSAQASGSPVWSTRRWCLEPLRPLSTGLGPVSEPPFFGLDVAGVGDRPRPLDLTSGVQSGEQQLVQALPDPGPLPLVQAPPAGRARAEAELERQVAPGEPRVQHEQDPAERFPDR